MLSKPKSLFWHKEIDERIKLTILKSNLTMTVTLSAFASVLIAFMLFSSYNYEGTKQNKQVYLIGFIMSVSILIISLTFAKRFPKIVTILVYLSFSIYYIYGIMIGTITDPQGKTVTFMVMIVFMPTLFIIRPLHVFIVTSSYVSVFIFLCIQNKTGAVLSVDIIDSIVFGILGISSGLVVNYIKVRSFMVEQKLQETSFIDQLTQMRNRNAYEFEREAIPDLCRFNITVIYMDVNGLHECNNEYGHEYGDNMLIFIASTIKETFLPELCYRIGGDEFIAFVPDISHTILEQKLSNMIKKIESNDFHIAIGCEKSKVKHINLENVINSAEKKMLTDKKWYYKNMVNREVRNINTE